MLNKKAFTLIELLVVVVIMAILVAIAFPQYELAIEKARSREAILTLASIDTSLREQYLAIGTSSYSARPEGQTVFDSLGLGLGPGFVRGTDTRYICTAMFMYAADCNPWWGRCEISAYRLGGRNTPQKCGLYAMQDSKYVLGASVFFTRPTTKSCYNWSVGDHDFGTSFCGKLMAEGVIDNL